MADEGVRRLIEEATKESLNQSFIEAGRKYIAAAEQLEQQGNHEEAERTYRKAAEAYEQAANKYRSSKSYKNAALNMCLAGDIYADLADSDRAIRAYATAAEDLLAASGEYLMWGEESETRKGTALAVTASMIYLMIGMDDKAFQSARVFASQNASKLRFPATIRLSQIPQMLEGAIHSVDIQSFSSAENAIVTELKAALNNANAQDFIKYVDKGLEMAREILRGQLKMPKIRASLDLPVDVTFKEEFPLRAVIQNVGDGDAHRLKAEWVLDEGLVLVRGDRTQSVEKLPPDREIVMEIGVKCADPNLEGVREYQVLLRGTYADMLSTEYTLQAGPASLVVRDFKVTEKLQHDADVTEGRISLLRSTVEAGDLETEPLLRIVDSLVESLKSARVQIQQGELDEAKAKIALINKMVDTVDSTVGDDALVQRLKVERERAKREFASQTVNTLEQGVTNALERTLGRIQAETTAALNRWDQRASGIKDAAEALHGLRTALSDIVAELDQLYQQLPTASSTDDPQEAARRTKARNVIEQIRSRVAEVRSKIETIASSSTFQPGTRPDVPEEVRLAKDLVEELRRDLVTLFQGKKSELTR